MFTGEEVCTGTNSADGTVTFPLELEAPTGSEPELRYFYIMEDDTGKGGIDYDGQIYLAAVEIGRDSDGNAIAAWEMGTVDEMRR